LAISMEQAITRPGNHGKGALVRPLVLIISDWQGAAEQVEAYSFAGVVGVECRRVQSADGEWNADVQFTMTEEPGAETFHGSVHVQLRMEGTIVRGTYRGAFNSIAMSGRVGAGLVFEHMYKAPHNGLLLWLPSLSVPVKGLVVMGNGANLDDRHWALWEDLQAFAAANHLAVMATGELSWAVEAGEGDRILAGLKSLAEQSGRAELESVPVYFMGHSLGGGMAMDFNKWRPKRTAAFVSSHGITVVRSLPERARQNPGILTAGEVDPKVPPERVEAAFKSVRAEGAKVCLVMEQGENHPMGAGSMPFFIFFLQHVIAPGRGGAWLADNATWKSGITRIAPAEKYEGDTNLASWLPDQDVAYVYRGIATFDNPLKLERTGGHGPAYLRGEAVELSVASFGKQAWKSVGLYDGAVRIGEFTADKPNLRLTGQKPGAHAGTLVGVMADGTERTSIPVAWVIWP
jgi:predicted esterase